MSSPAVTVGATLAAKFSEPRDCPHGHPMIGRNLIVARTKAGHPNRKCRICANAAAARFRERRRATA